MKHRYLPPSVVQRGRHYRIEGATNVIPKILMTLKITFFVSWRFGSLEDEQRPVLVSIHHPQNFFLKLLYPIKVDKTLLDVC